MTDLNNKLRRDPLTEVPVPDYAAGSCFVSIEFRGQYVFIPMAILLAVNILLIAMTMAIFLKAKCRNSKSTNIGNATNTYKLTFYLQNVL